MKNQNLLDHPNVVFTPRIAFNSVETVERINTKTIENIKACLAGVPRNVITSGSALLWPRFRCCFRRDFELPPSRQGDTVNPP